MSEPITIHVCGPSRPTCECKCDETKRDCGHVWDGPIEEGETPFGGYCSSATCSKCGMSAIAHDMWVGP